MSEKPQAPQTGEQEDLIEQIIVQELEKLTAPAQAAATEEAPPETAPEQVDGREADPPANKKIRRSAVYLYLLILFGAAFLMLLLAYFIQQRNNVNDINDLPSRVELLAQITALKEEKEALSSNLSILQRSLAEQKQTSDETLNQVLDITQANLYSWQLFWELERFYQAGDYESCAAVLILQGQPQYTYSTPDLADAVHDVLVWLAESQYTYSTPDSAQERYEEIVRAVIDAGILDEEYYLHPEDYAELLGYHLIPVERTQETADG